MLRTPALTYGNDLVQQFAGANRALANGLLAVVTTGTVFAQAVQVLALRLGFNLATSMPRSRRRGPRPT